MCGPRVAATARMGEETWCGASCAGAERLRASAGPSGRGRAGPSGRKLREGGRRPSRPSAQGSRAGWEWKPAASRAREQAGLTK